MEKMGCPYRASLAGMSVATWHLKKGMFAAQKSKYELVNKYSL